QDEDAAQQGVQRRSQHTGDHGVESGHEPIEVHRHSEAWHVAKSVQPAALRLAARWTDRVGGYREEPGKAPAGSRTSEHDFHLIEGEDVRLVRRPVAELAGPIEYLVDEGTMPIRRGQPCPLDEGRLGEAGKRIP